jgi:uncharacterized protein YraI
MDTLEGSAGAQGDDEAPPPPPELEALSSVRQTKGTSPFSPVASRQSLEGWHGLLNNRFLLSALAIVVVLLLTAIVLVAIGQGGAGTEGDTPSNIGGSLGGAKTPARPVGGLSAKTTTTLSFRNGPGASYPILGTIPRGAVVAVVGRNGDQSWLQVRYPPNSNLKGWVDAQLLDVNGDLTTLVVAGPGPVASAEITFVPPAAVVESATATETFAAAQPTSTARPGTPTVRRTPTRTPRQFTTPTPTLPELPSATPLLTPQG